MAILRAENWQSLLIAGNDFYQSCKWQEAEEQYDLAFAILMEECQKSPTSCEVLMAWICTCHNLSSLFESQNKLPAAMRYLLLPHEHCKYIVAEHSASEEAKSLAIQAMSVTLPPIVEFSNNHPHLTERNQLVNQASSLRTDNSIH